MELHGMSHDVRHLVVPTVVHAFHGVQDAALHRLQTVLDMGDGTFQNNVRSIVQEPVLVHTAQVVYGSRIEAVYRFVVGVTVFTQCVVGFYILDFVVHFTQI